MYVYIYICIYVLIRIIIALHAECASCLDELPHCQHSFYVIAFILLSCALLLLLSWLADGTGRGCPRLGLTSDHPARTYIRSPDNKMNALGLTSDHPARKCRGSLEGQVIYIYIYIYIYISIPFQASAESPSQRSRSREAWPVLSRPSLHRPPKRGIRKGRSKKVTYIYIYIYIYKEIDR